MEPKIKEIFSNYKYELLTDFPIEQQTKLKGLLAGADKYDNKIFAKIYSVLVDTKADDNDELLWNTRIMFASFIITDNNYELLDNFFVPVRPFRIRTSYENGEMQQLISKIFDEVSEIAAKLDLPELEAIENNTNIGKA